MHFGMVECRVPPFGHCDLDIDRWHCFKSNCVHSISPSLFVVHVDITSLACGCILMMEGHVPFLGRCELYFDL